MLWILFGGGLCKNRTCDLQLRRLALYPTELIALLICRLLGNCMGIFCQGQYFFAILSFVVVDRTVLIWYFAKNIKKKSNYH